MLLLRWYLLLQLGVCAGEPTHVTKLHAPQLAPPPPSILLTPSLWAAHSGEYATGMWPSSESVVLVMGCCPLLQLGVPNVLGTLSQLCQLEQHAWLASG
jgi:hypothetical protein